jgi:predicted glycoside hydrolase/deacetylase ChbG (UPF0249 family)
MPRLVLCADDYGISPGVCDAIDFLAGEGRISASGAMTLFPEWRQRAQGLRRIAAVRGIDVGVHLTLTDHEPLSKPVRLCVGGALPRLSALLRDAQLRRLPAVEIEAEIKAQLDAFEDAFGAPPAFVDGHQHVHVFPIVRRLLTAEIARRYGRSCWVRSIVEPWGAILRRGVAAFKAAVLSGLGAGFDRLADDAGFSRNDSFRGAYDLSLRVPYGQLFARFLDDAGGHPACPLIFCHPGHADALLSVRSTLAEARAAEYAYFASSAFDDDCSRAGYRIAAFGAGSQPSGGGE